jgi:hypothetical protein
MQNLQNIGSQVSFVIASESFPLTLSIIDRDNFYKTNADNFFRNRKWWASLFLSLVIPSPF